jgi:hypothetical protein
MSEHEYKKGDVVEFQDEEDSPTEVGVIIGKHVHRNCWNVMLKGEEKNIRANENQIKFSGFNIFDLFKTLPDNQTVDLGTRKIYKKDTIKVTPAHNAKHCPCCSQFENNSHE